MTLKTFTELIENVKKFDKELDRWNEFGIELFDMPVANHYYDLFNLILTEFFNTNGIDWIHWWLYEKQGLYGEVNQAYDKDNNIIPTETVEDLWNLVKEYQK